MRNIMLARVAGKGDMGMLNCVEAQLTTLDAWMLTTVRFLVGVVNGSLGRMRGCRSGEDRTCMGS